jgi:hypothetical protein
MQDSLAAFTARVARHCVYDTRTDRTSYDEQTKGGGHLRPVGTRHPQHVSFP